MVVALAVLVSGCYKGFDFDNDNHADFIVVLGNGAWRDLEAPPTDPPLYVQGSGDRPVPADYDGDGRYDVAALTTNGDWVTQTSVGTVHFPAPPQLAAYTGQPSFRYQMDPVPADYDGDKKADMAWYRDTDGSWFINGQPTQQFGTGPTAIVLQQGMKGNDVIDQDLPAPADYDNDGKADLATFNPRTMVWKVKSSRDGTVSSVTMPGTAFDLGFPVQGDYDGVHHPQRALYTLVGWRIEGHVDPIVFDPTGGASGDGTAVPAVADYDGDGRTDLSYLSTTGVWYTRSSAHPSTITSFTIGKLSSFSSTAPVEFPTYLMANIARLTLLSKNCWPGTPTYPADC
jgi:hypothetical protein